MKKIKIGVLFGGKSAEHEVSVLSAQNVIKALDKAKYQITPVRINGDGKFNAEMVKRFDVIFPVLHGPFGEDGSMQGLLKLAGVPFVGAGVLGSAVGMDKDIMKKLLRDAGIPIGKFLTVKAAEKINFSNAKKLLGLPIFIKPANMGSSVGVNKAKNEKEFKKAIAEAFKFDNKILMEEFIDAREIECAVLGNDHPMASVPGEIIANQEFYSYDAKYIDEGSICEIPAKIDKKTAKRVQELALQTFQALNCEGLGRVDCFLKKDGTVLVNEINTLPGFTNISMYPKLWAASGIPQTKLLDRLIDLAIERFRKEKNLKTSIK
jgi:D-alanine-D-alanine ligase